MTRIHNTYGEPTCLSCDKPMHVCVVGSAGLICRYCMSQARKWIAQNFRVCYDNPLAIELSINGGGSVVAVDRPNQTNSGVYMSLHSSDFMDPKIGLRKSSSVFDSRDVWNLIGGRKYLELYPDCPHIKYLNGSEPMPSFTTHEDNKKRHEVEKQQAKLSKLSKQASQKVKMDAIFGGLRTKADLHKNIDVVLKRVQAPFTFVPPEE